MDRHVPGPVEHNRVVTGYGQLARLTLQRAAQHWRELDEHIARSPSALRSIGAATPTWAEPRS
jgi:hypothetical protein